MTKPKQPNFNMRFTETLLEKVKARAEREGISTTEFVERSLAQMIGKPTNEEKLDRILKILEEKL